MDINAIEREEVARLALKAATVAEARAVQERMRRLVLQRPLTSTPQLIAGADVSFDRFSPWLHAAVVVIDTASGETVAEATATERARFPYVPGYLSFREAPPVLAAWNALGLRPDLLVVDGQGYAHPRRCGIACHLGILLDLPTIGCAKSRLIGTHDTPGPEPGDAVPLIYDEERVGTVLRTRRRSLPLYVSIGYAITLDEAVEQVLRLCGGYRLPLTTRRAHERVNQVRRAHAARENERR